MLNYLKKHWVLSSLIAIVLFFPSLCYYVFSILIAIDSGRYWHSVVLTQPSKTVFEYVLPYPKYPKRCLELALDLEAIDQKYSSIDSEFDQKFRVNVWEKMSDEEYVSHMQGKPHFIARIYQAGELKDTQEVYMMEKKSTSSAYVGGFKVTTLAELAGYNRSKQLTCYEFSPDIVYTIEVINQTPLAEFQDIDAFLGLGVPYMGK